MLSTQVHYHQFENETAQAMVSVAIQSIVRHMPSWVRSVQVYGYDKLGEGVVAACRPEPDYRRVVFEVSSLFYDCPAEKQREYMRHEFFHAMLGEVGAWVQKRLIAPVENSNSDLHAVIQQEFMERMERVVQELTFMFAELLGESNEKEESA